MSSYDDPRITAVGLFNEAYGGLNSRLAEQLGEHGLDGAEFDVLIRLARTPGGALRMTDLAAQTHLTTSGVTRVVDRLERDELVRRLACPTDRRGSFAEITINGLTRLDAVLPGHLDLIDHWLIGQLSPEQLDGLIVALRILRDVVRPGATAGAGGDRTTVAPQAGPGDARLTSDAPIAAKRATERSTIR